MFRVVFVFFVVYLYVTDDGSIASVGEEGAVCLLLFVCGYVVSVWRGFLFLWVLWMGYVVCYSAPSTFHVVVFQNIRLL